MDANHAGNMMTRRSHTGILIYVQNAPIIWFSKRQNTVEASSFECEFVALRATKEMIVALCYKLRMFGVAIDGPANVFCDNNGVIKRGKPNYTGFRLRPQGFRSNEIWFPAMASSYFRRR